MRRYASPLLALAVWAWLTLILVAPVRAAGVSLSAATYLIGSRICHQQSARSFHLAGAQLPVCARCTGLYVGAAAGVVSALVARRRARVTIGPLEAVLVAGAVLTAVTWGIEAAGVAALSNPVRAATAVPLGVAVAVVVMATVDQRLR